MSGSTSGEGSGTSNSCASRLNSTANRSRPCRARACGTSPAASAPKFHICAIGRSRDTGRTATAAPAWWRSKVSACWPRRANGQPCRRHEGSHAAPSVRRRRGRMVMELLVADQPRRENLARPELCVLELGGTNRRHRKPLSRRAALGARSKPSGDAGQSRRLHPMQSLRPRVPRGAGERRDRHGVSQCRRRRSCSTSTIRWARPPASPAASACRPARPAR